MVKLSNEYELYHHGIKGQKWGVRRFQNIDGSYTNEGKKRYGISERIKKRKEYVSLKLNDPKVKKAIKIGAAVAATALVAYGAYKINDKIMINKMTKVAKENAERIYGPTLKKLSEIADTAEELRNETKLTNETFNDFIAKRNKNLKLKTGNIEQPFKSMLPEKGAYNSYADRIKSENRDILTKMLESNYKPNPNVNPNVNKRLYNLNNRYEELSDDLNTTLKRINSGKLSKTQEEAARKLYNEKFNELSKIAKNILDGNR